jgi:hypothetical protein
MNNVTRQDIHLAIDHVILGHKIAVVFANPLGKVRQRVRVIQKTYGKSRPKPISASMKQAELIVSIGPPNYAEREFLKLCKKAKTKPRKLWFPKR